MVFTEQESHQRTYSFIKEPMVTVITHRSQNGIYRYRFLVCILRFQTLGGLYDKRRNFEHRGLQRRFRFLILRTPLWSLRSLHSLFNTQFLGRFVSWMILRVTLGRLCS